MRFFYAPLPAPGHEPSYPLLVSVSAKHLRMLHAVDCFPGDGGLYHGPALQDAIRRYEQCWLPLLADVLARQPSKAAKLVPPLDVAWVWHLHRLDPVAYQADCERLFDRVLSLPDERRNFEFSNGSDRQSKTTQTLWRRFKEPFHPPAMSAPRSGELLKRPRKLKLRPGYPRRLLPALRSRRAPRLADSAMSGPLVRHSPGAAVRNSTVMDSALEMPRGSSALLRASLASSRGDGAFVSDLQPNLEAVAAQQPQFLRQVLRHSYTSHHFLEDAARRYFQFMRLRQALPDLRAVPLYDIAFMWRTHMGMPQTYQFDCKAILGRVLDYDVSIEDCLSGQHTDPAFKETVEAWVHLYLGQPYKVEHTGFVPRRTPHLASLLLQQHGFVRCRAVSMRRLRMLFGADYLAHRGGALALFLLNNSSAVDRLARGDVTALPHSSTHSYWKASPFRQRDVNQVASAVVAEYRAWCEALTCEEYQGEPGIYPIVQPKALMDAWAFWFPMHRIRHPTNVIVTKATQGRRLRLLPPAESGDEDDGWSESRSAGGLSEARLFGGRSRRASVDRPVAGASCAF